MKCIVCQTEFIPNEKGECSYCAAEKAAAKELIWSGVAGHPILTESNYFSPEANQYYMSASQFKSFQQCESMALAELRGDYIRESSTALLVGSYVDAHFGRTLDIFKAQHPEIFKRDGTLLATYEHANNIIARIERDDLMMAALSGQSQVIMTGEIEGIPVKVKIDSLRDDAVVDLKILRDMEDIYNQKYMERQPFWKYWGYDKQGAIYTEIVRQNTGKSLPFVLAIATKEKPEPDIDLLKISDNALRVALDEVRAEIVYMDGLKRSLYPPNRCESCAFCRATKVLSGYREVG